MIVPNVLSLAIFFSRKHWSKQHICVHIYIYTDMYIYIYINREMFTQKEQDELINSFLDVTKVSDYLKKLRELTKIASARIVTHTIAKLPPPESIF